MSRDDTEGGRRKTNVGMKPDIIKISTSAIAVENSNCFSNVAFHPFQTI
jgi:hypothetical protein